MGYSWIARLLACLTVVLLVGCTDSPTNSTRTTDNEPATVVLSSDDSAAAEALDGSLTVGDEAPPLDVTSWVKGSQVDDFEEGQIYVVEFWATWCGPCKASMPHIGQLQREYQDDVTFIGISNEELETVEKFFASQQSEGKTWDEVADYTFAMDGDIAMGKAYMTAAGQTRIPTAFIVGRDGRIEWVGDPMSIDEPLEKIVNDQWDRLAFAEKFNAAVARDKAIKTARTLSADQNWDEALIVVDDLWGQFPDDPEIGMLKVNILISADRATEGVAALEEVGRANWDDPNMLNGISWMIATEIPEAARDLDLALEIANRATELSNDNSPSVLDTLARVHYEKGQLEEAIQWQEKAVVAGDGDPSLQRTLDDYLQQRDGDDDGDDDGEDDGEDDAMESEQEEPADQLESESESGEDA